MIYKKNHPTSLTVAPSLLLQGERKSDTRMEFIQMLTAYEGALKEVSTRLEILDAEFRAMHDHNPIHHMESRIKSMESIMGKLSRKELEPTIENIVTHITDVVGLRIICHYIEDIYHLAELLRNQEGITVVRQRDYINSPKRNGYRSMHLVVKVPVALSNRTEQVQVEIQLRTIAMDMWASLEHELHYKSAHQPVEHLAERLRRCAVSLADIDLRMQEIYNHLKSGGEEEDDS